MKRKHFFHLERGGIQALVLLVLFFAGRTVEGAILTADRQVDWSRESVGVPGGIPNVTNIFTTILSPTPISVTSALRSCPSNQVVKLGPGVFVFTDRIDWQGVNDGVVLRGTVLSGSNATRIISSGFHVINFRSQFSEAALGVAANITQDVIKGDRVITLAAVPAWVKVGHLYGIDQINDEVLASTHTCREGAGIYRARAAAGSNGNRGLGQLFKVVATTATTITTENPLYYPFKVAQSAQVFQAGYDATASAPRRRCGIEDLCLEGAAAANSAHTIAMENCDGCWIRNVTSRKVQGNCHVITEFSYRCEIRDSTFDDGFLFNAGQAYGVALYDLSCHNLIENNIFHRLHVAMQANYGSGGNVFAYNYSSGNVSDVGEEPAINVHGCHAYMNLFEGNICAQKAMFDCIHGSSSHNLLFRNRLAGFETGKSRNQCAIDIDYWNRKCSVIGNVCGSEGFHTTARIQAPATSWTDKIVYKWGYVNAFGQQTGCFDPAPTMELLFHGNYDTVSKAVLWEPTLADHSLPNSLYLTRKPSWFGKLTWPPVDPLAPKTYVGFETNIPAGYRYVYRVDPPRETVGQPPIAVATASQLIAAPQVPITFSSTGSFDPEGVALSYRWDFGDGEISVTANPVHAYLKAGNFAVRLTVSNGRRTSPGSQLNVKIAAGN